MSNFIHLHVHSHYSLLDGLPKIPDLVAFAREQEMTALALTDHGVLYGALEFYKQCKRAGIKPIIGVECYVAPDDLKNKQTGSGFDYYHIVLLARNLEGYKNLLQLVTIAHLDGFYYKPRIDKPTLAKYSKGLIGLSGCLRGEIARTIQLRGHEDAVKLAREYQNIFEPGYFFLELQRNMPDEIQEQTNKALVRISRETGIPLVATGDTHYLKPDDAVAQDILVCVGTGRTVNETDRLDMRSSRLDMKSAAEMEKLFSDLPEALEATVKIAESIDLQIPLQERHFPSFTVPDGTSAESYLEKLCYQGMAERHNLGFRDIEDIKQALPGEVRERLQYEIGVIQDKGYAAYFLVVADFATWARKRGIILTTRGSAAGSLVAYALGITTMNPIEYKLPFERFLNPYRPTPPDIDMDFADNRRDEVIEYVSQKYGRDKVAQIATFGTMMARAAVRDVGRALGIAYFKCDRIAKMIPFGKQGFHMTIERALEISPDLKTVYEKDPETKNLIDLARKVEGCARHASVHAAGVVIAPTKLTDYTPLQMDTDNKNIITQFDMHSVEDAGLIKMDFLGIRNLSILGNSVEIVRATRGIEVDLQNLPLNDAKTFELLSSGRTIGVFQLGGSGMTKYLVDLKPSSISDIMAMISLYRPGPIESIPEFIERKHNPKKITYLDARLKDILDMSYGVITYQEDVLLTAINIAGYTWEEADKLRKAMGKKIPKEMAAQKEKFIQGAITGGLSSEKAIKLWSLIEPFAAYGFGKAHAASYAVVAYQTAYMKANYPVEFMAAVMTAEANDNTKVAAAVAESAAMQIQVLPPDINESLSNFTVTGEREIRFGLGAIKNLGSDVISATISERKANGIFSSLTDFIQRVRTRNFNKKSWEALVKSGTMDRFGERNQMLAATESILEFARSNQRQETSKQSALFANSKSSSDLLLKNTVPATEQEKLSWEKELLGLYVSSHPLKNLSASIVKYALPISSLDQSHDNNYCVVAGIFTTIKNILTKKGEPMCFAELEDIGGALELVIFPGVFNEYKQLISVDKIVLAKGKVSDKDGELKLLVDSLKSIDDPDLDEWASQKPETRYRGPNNRFEVRTDAPPAPAQENSLTSETKLLKIKIPAKADPQIFSRLKTIFSKFPGSTSVSLIIPDRENNVREIKTEFLIDNTQTFKTELRTILRESILPKK